MIYKGYVVQWLELLTVNQGVACSIHAIAAKDKQYEKKEISKWQTSIKKNNRGRKRKI